MYVTRVACRGVRASVRCVAGAPRPCGPSPRVPPPLSDNASCAAQAVFKVAFLAAERTLYLPSVGAAVIFADLLGVVAGLDGDTALAAACDVQVTPAPSASHRHSATPPPYVRTHSHQLAQ